MRRAQAGMTLLEILIVLAILALVMGLLVGPRVVTAIREARIKTTRLQVFDLAYSAFPAWQVDHASVACPDELAELARYVRGQSLRDAWGEAIAMRCGETAPPDEEFGALSKGPDQRDATTDDIASWHEATWREAGR